jgi:Na+/H+-dicarboxylate symporter
MKKIHFALQYQIILGLILGSIFGLLFPVPKSSIQIRYLDKNKEKKIILQNQDSIIVNYWDLSTNKSFTKTFTNKQTPLIINYFKKISQNQNNINFEYYLYKNGLPFLRITHIIETNKVETLATIIKPIGNVFIQLLFLLAIPLVLTTLIAGTASLKDIKTLGKIGIKTLILYLFTTVLALIIGISLANVIKPGLKIDKTSKFQFKENASEFAQTMTQNIDFDVSNFVINSIPKNIFEALVSGNLLQIVFFSLFFGIALMLVGNEKSKIITDFLTAISDVLIKMVELVMKLAPIGVFALISYTIADFGVNIISTLFWYIFTVLLGLFIHTIVSYSVLLKLLSKYPVIKFFQKIRYAQAIAFSSSSSAATLPVTIETAEKELMLPRKITSFVLPLGAIINMDGTALYQGVAAIFIAQFYSIDLNLIQQATIVLMGVLASIGTSPVPGVGIIMLIGILQSVGLPAEGIGLILGVDRILDMSRTITNITGDLVVATIVSKNETN